MWLIVNPNQMLPRPTDIIRGMCILHPLNGRNFNPAGMRLKS